jgi:hypothetical protein
VHRLAHDESLAAVGEAAEVELAAGLQGFAFDAKVTVKTAFVLRKSRKRSEKQQRGEYRGGLHFFRFEETFLAFGLIDGDFLAAGVSFFGADFFFAVDFLRAGAAAAARARGGLGRSGAGGLIVTAFFATCLGLGRERR